MLELSGYRIEQQIHQSSNTRVYRGQRLSDDKAVVLKQLNHEHPMPLQLARFKREYELTCRLELAGCIRAYELVPNQHNLVIVLEDIGGESLNRWLKVDDRQRPTAFRRQRESLPELLRLAVTMSDALAQLHGSGLIHRDVNPSNIVYNPVTDQMQLIDFGLATKLVLEYAQLEHPNTLEGTLAYLAPEQTGRMNRAVDQRSDLYSLGVTLFELFTGQRPFNEPDALGLIHAHLAKAPPLPQRQAAYIPDIVADIILKLLAKNAEQRYQSALGLKADLSHCLQSLQRAEPLSAFTLARHDTPEQLHIPETLYGRESELQQLLATFERCSQGSCELLLVNGPAGIGKSVLVQELYRPITEKRGYFIAGKFDQYQRNIPYASLLEAFRSLIRLLLTGSEQELADWRQRLLQSLGPNGQVIIDVIPEIELIIGPQPALPTLGPTETQNRFNRVFQQFIGVFTQAEHPLVIFLDDLQWADNASLRLLEHLLSIHSQGYLLILGTYRDSEVNGAHALTRMLNNLQEAQAPLTSLNLKPLQLPHINDWLSDALRCPRERVAELAELVLTKTEGNPFFSKAFMKMLANEGLIYFDASSEVGAWHWDLERIKTQTVTENVVELLSNKLQLLPADTQQVLTLAACIGNRFELELLATVAAKTPLETAQILWPALQDGLLVPLSGSYELQLHALDAPSSRELSKTEYRFVHDRIQQAVYELVDASAKTQQHAHVARRLYQHTDLNQHPERVFAVVNQFNLGQAALNGPAERETLAALNLQAGQQAKAATAYEPAEEYLRQGLELLSEDSWQQNYELSLKLHLEAAEVAYLNDNLHTMELLLATLLQQSRATLDSTRAYEIKIQAYALKSEFTKALDTTIEALRLIGVRLPRNPSLLHVFHAVLRTKLALAGKSTSQIRDQAAMTDEKQLVAMRILMSAVAAAYLTDSFLLLLLVTTGIRLSLRYGNCAESAFFYSTYGLVLCGFLGELDKGYEFGQLATELSTDENTQALTAKINTMTSCFINHWKTHSHQAMKQAIEGYDAGLQTGDLEYASHCATIHALYLLYTGVDDFKSVEKEIAAYSEVLSTYVFSMMNVYRFAQMRQYIDNLAGKNDDPCLLSGAHLNENQALKQYHQLNDGSLISSFYLLKLMLCYAFHDYPQAIKNSIQSERHLNNLAASLFVPLFYFYDSLARLAHYPKMSAKERLITRWKVIRNQQKLKKWARHAPMNYAHRYHLVEAERLRVMTKSAVSVGDHYEKAIRLAREHHYLNEEAMACELAGQFYCERQQQPFAAHYLREACYAYQRWGATAKVEDLQARYAELFETNRDGRGQFLNGFPSGFPNGIEAVPNDNRETLSTTISVTTQLDQFDLDTILEAARTLSQEIELVPLMKQLLQLVLSIAGAQRSLLVVEHGSRWLLQARQDIVDDSEQAHTTLIPTGLALDEADPARLPSGILYYVARTRTQLVLDDASEEGIFTYDPYVLATQAKSVLCTPLLNQGKLNALLYLENNLTTQAFTAKQLELVQLLSTQAAVALENARLYENLGRSEQQYRRLFEDSRDAIIITTLQGYVIESNKALLDMGGYQREELIQHNVQEFYVDLDVGQRFRQALEENGSVKDFEMQLRHKSGQPRDCLVTASLYKAEQETLIQCIVRDITERKHAERLQTEYHQHLQREVQQRTAELQQMTHEAQTARAAAEKAMLAEQKRIDWLENMAGFLRHETKNAVIGATMSIDFIRRKSQDSSVGKYVGRADRSLKHIEDVLENIANASSLEAAFSKNEENAKTAIDFSRLVEEHIRGYDDVYSEHQIDTDVVDNVIIEGSEIFLMQMLDKIVSNAIDYNQPGKPVQVKLFIKNDNAILEIVNEGQKLPDDRESLFELFVSKRTDKQRQDSNIGLGLYVVKLIAGFHDGEVYASDPDGFDGARFTVVLPLAKTVNHVNFQSTDNLSRAHF